MGTIDKALSLLSLFSSEEPQWTVEAAASRIGVPTSTVYRYFRGLTEAGLIADFTAGRYVIGPGIIELDRIARRMDPLILAAQGAMDELAATGSERNVVLLSRIYRRRVMCVDQRKHGYHPLMLSYERGRPMPLYRGSVSKIILANLPSRTLARCHAEDGDEIAAAGLGADLQSFRQNLRAIRKAGRCISKGEVDQGVTGISAPISGPEGDVFASLSLVVPDDPAIPQDPEFLGELVVQGARKTSQALLAMSERRTLSGEGPAKAPARGASRSENLAIPFTSS